MVIEGKGKKAGSSYDICPLLLIQTLTVNVAFFLQSLLIK